MNEPERFEQKMRQNRLVFYEKDIRVIEEKLDRFLEASQARCILLVDLEGHMVTGKGFIGDLDTTSISALVAGSFASTREVARKLGETEFSVLFHQGSNENIHISLIANRALAVIIFDDRTTIGMVRLYAQQVADDLTQVLTEMGDRGEEEGGEELSSDYTDAAAAQIDDFFNEDEQKDSASQ